MRSMDERDYEAAARSLFATLGQERTRDLIRLLELDDVTRADAFRQLHERGGREALLDAFTDLELDPVVRGWLIEYLKVEIGEP